MGLINIKLGVLVVSHAYIIVVYCEYSKRNLNLGRLLLLFLFFFRFLPVKDVTETSLKVSIQHDRKYHTVATETELCEV